MTAYAGQVPDSLPGHEWMDHGLCHVSLAEEDVWFSDLPREREIAANICRACPVRQQCAERGANEPFGVWGATTERDRRSQRAGTGSRELLVEQIRDLAEAGTVDQDIAAALGIPARKVTTIRDDNAILPGSVATAPERCRDICGTPAGAMTHRRNRERLCRDCRQIPTRDIPNHRSAITADEIAAVRRLAVGDRNDQRVADEIGTTATRVRRIRRMLRIPPAGQRQQEVTA